MSNETFMTLMEISYNLCEIAFLTIPLFGIPYGIKKIKHWKEKENNISLNKGCTALITSGVFLIVFILFAIKDLFFRHN